MKKVLFVSGGVLASLVLIFLAFVLLSDINSYKPRIEAAAASALGMDVKIGGRMGVVLLPNFGVSLSNVAIRNRHSDIFFAERVRVGLRLIPLIRRQLRITNIELIRPRLSIERDKNGTLNFGRSTEEPVKESSTPSLTVASFSVSKGGLSYLDSKSGSSAEMKGVDLTMRDLSSKGGTDILKDPSFTGDLKCPEFTYGNIRISNLAFDIKAENGTYTVEPVTMEIFKGAGKAAISLDLKNALSVIEMNGTVSNFSFGEFVGSLSGKKIVEGNADLSIRLSAKAKSLNEIEETLSGEVAMHGENLILHQFDIDALLSQFQKSQSFNLVDIGAFVFAGPLGTSLTKGYDFAGVYRESLGGKGTIEKLVSKWEVRNGVAEAKDVALTTKKNRIALQGKIDFVHERFDSITVAVLDEKGCAKFSQRIRGSFRNPQIERPSILKSVAGPVLKLLDKTEKLLTSNKCAVFYSGSLPQPE